VLIRKIGHCEGVMREDAIQIEEGRIGGVADVEDYPSYHERHRVFPGVFETRNHKKIIDLSAGVGVVGKNIKQKYPGYVVCNEISPSCLRIMKKAGLDTMSFDIDSKDEPFPVAEKSFDAVITLATIEHMIHVDHFMEEIRRILTDDGFLYISAPNYSGLLYLVPFVISGKTFHDPLSEQSKYEFYAHVRYFTYRTLTEYVNSFGFWQDTVYIPLPENSSRFQRLQEKSKIRAVVFRNALRIIYQCFGPRWSSEPVICFQKGRIRKRNVRKIIL
jgi:SAM-dependent methyltransferase